MVYCPTRLSGPWRRSSQTCWKWRGEENVAEAVIAGIGLAISAYGSYAQKQQSDQQASAANQTAGNLETEQEGAQHQLAAQQVANFGGEQEDAQWMQFKQLAASAQGLSSQPPAALKGMSSSQAPAAGTLK